MKSNFKKLISFLISYSLIFNNILYASSIVLLDVNKDTKIYDINEEDTTIIDIARPSDTLKKISLNLFKIFNTEKRKILINNSKVKIKSRLTNKEIEANQNYKNDEDISDIIIFFTPSEPKGSNLSSYFEILGNNKVDFIFSDPNGLISKGGQYINIRKLSLISGSYDNGNYKVLNNSAKISILPLENDSHLGINAGEIDELYLLSREINISGEIILKGLLSMETRVDNGDNKINKPKFSFQTSSFGNIQAGSIKLITLEPDTDVNITTSIITTMDDMIFNLNRNLLLSGNTAKLISERSKLTINATNLTLDNSSTISSYEDMTLTIKNSLLNTNKSLIHTQSGNIVMKLQELKNHNASIIQSGSKLIINGKLIENVGVNSENTHNTIKEYTGQEPWRGVVPTSKENIIVTMTTNPSLILSRGTMTLNTDNLQNRSSNIVSKSKLIINGIVLNNERNSFIAKRLYTGEKDYLTDEVIIKWRHFYPEFFHRHRRSSGSVYNEELFYSNTPSLIVGNEVEMYIADMILQDQNNLHKDASVDFVSRISSKSLLKIRSGKIINHGILEMGSPNIEIVDTLSNIGGIILASKEGYIKTNILNNFSRTFMVDVYINFTERHTRGDPIINGLVGIAAGAVNGLIIGNPVAGAVIGTVSGIATSFEQKTILNGDRIHFEDPTQPGLIGIAGDVKQLQITADSLNGEGEIDNKDKSGKLIIKAKQVSNIGSYLISGKGTMEVISDRLLIINKEISNRLSIGLNYKEIVSNINSGIVGNRISFDISGDALIAGTNIKLIDQLKIKARRLAILDAQNRAITVTTTSNSITRSEVIQSTRPMIQANSIEIETEEDTTIKGVNTKTKKLSITSKKGNVNIENSKDKKLEVKKEIKRTHKDVAGKLTSAATAAVTAIPSGPIGMAIAGTTSATLYQGSEIETDTTIDEEIVRPQIEVNELTIHAKKDVNIRSVDIKADKKDIQYGNKLSATEDEETHIHHEKKTEKLDTNYPEAIVTGVMVGALTDGISSAQEIQQRRRIREIRDESPRQIRRVPIIEEPSNEEVDSPTSVTKRHKNFHVSDDEDTNDIMIGFEGKRNEFYVDTEHNLTIGVGANVHNNPKLFMSLDLRNSKGERITDLREKERLFRELKDIASSVDESLCYSSNNTIPGIDWRIDDNEVRRVLHEQLHDSAQELRVKFGTEYFNSLPENIQRVLLDMQFNMGNNKFNERTWPKLHEAVKKGDWKTAYEECGRAMVQPARREWTKEMFRSQIEDNEL